MRLHRTRIRVLPALLAPAALLLASCGSGGGGGAASQAVEPERATFRAADFVDPTTSSNRWHPLEPGLQWVREGTTEVGSREVPHQVVTTMTDVIRKIDGVPAVAMLDEDTDAGQVTQVSVDYLALDDVGNVWDMGGYTEAYSGGEFTNAEDAWLGRASGGEPGILLRADPDTSTPRWFIENHPGDEGSAAEVVDKGTRKCVPFACYDDVLVVREGKISAIDNEFKFYAPGVGLIFNAPKQDSKHKDTEALVNQTHLSPAALDQAAREVRRLEEHARHTSPDVFGDAPASQRAP